MVQGEFFEVPQSETASDELAETPERTRRGLKDFTIPRLYYGISEVSAMIGIEQYILRYWETEFSELRPHKNRSGNRVYSEKDIKIATRIKELLRDKRYTIEGARLILSEELDAEKKSPPMPAAAQDHAQLPIIPPEEIPVMVSELQEIKKSLIALREILARSK